MTKTIGNGAQSMADKVAMAKARYDKGKPNTTKPAPKAKISLKGTNPLKKRLAITITKRF